MSAALESGAPRAGALDRLLRPFAEVRAGEGVTALLLMLNVFLLLTAYYLIKTMREPLILATGGAEVKSYAAAGQAVLLLGLVPLYGLLASRVNRLRLISWVTLFFISNLLLFWFLIRAHAPFIGVAFYLWVGIFNLMIIAQFWSFANDVYVPEQGKRLFAIVAFGSTIGAIFGAWLAKPLIAALGVTPLALIAAAILLASLALTWVVHSRELAARVARGRESAPEPIGGRNGFALVFSDRYLLLIALLMVVLNVVNTNGEYILSKFVTLEAAKQVAAGAAAGADAGEWTGKFIGGFYADYFFWVNLAAALIQMLLVSRILKWWGVRGALFVMPVLSFTGYGLLATAPLLAAVRLVKIFENATDYSLQNTARQALWLPTSREAKYKAKSAVDSFFVRMGDLTSGGLVFMGAALSLTPQRFAAINLGLVVVWLVLLLFLIAEHRKVSAER